MNVSMYGVQDKQLRSSERWLCFAALFFLGFTATFNQFKAAPCYSEFIGADLGMSVDMRQIIGVCSRFRHVACISWHAGHAAFRCEVLHCGHVRYPATVGSHICVFSQSTLVFLLGAHFWRRCCVWANLRYRALISCRVCSLSKIRVFVWVFGSRGRQWAW